jgi:hypothetical protein
LNLLICPEIMNPTGLLGSLGFVKLKLHRILMIRLTLKSSHSGNVMELYRMIERTGFVTVPPIKLKGRDLDYGIPR